MLVYQHHPRLIIPKKSQMLGVGMSGGSLEFLSAAKGGGRGGHEQTPPPDPHSTRMRRPYSRVPPFSLVIHSISVLLKRGSRDSLSPRVWGPAL